MAKHLREKDIEKIIGLLDRWEGKLTWEALTQACESVIGTKPARQTLDRHERIRHAFKVAKDRVKRDQEQKKSYPPDLEMAAQRIEYLENQVERLQKENQRLLEQFVRWEYNAYARGINPLELDSELPPIDRGNTGPN